MRHPFSAEFTGSCLGDERRSDRLVQLGLALMRNPSGSFPSVLGDGAELEAAYRFLSNPSVEANAVLEPHCRETTARCQGRDNVIVAHDTTDFVFPGTNRRGLGRMRGDKELGFFAHVALAVSGDEVGEPLGVLHLETWTRPEKKKRASKKSPRARMKDSDRESTRWERGADVVDERLESGQVIHVMDREADAYELLAGLITKERRFVVRSTFDRKLADGGKLQERVTAQPVVVEREVALSKRKPGSAPKQRKVHPPRNARIARLGLKTLSVTLLRPRDQQSSLPEQLQLNVVVVEEVDPPQDEPAVLWRLYTSEPINTASDAERIVDAYRRRWTIEEFFKALKSGCQIEKRQLETGHALMNAVAIYIPIAWRVLRHRTLAQADASRSARDIMTPLQLKILRKQSKEALPRALNVADALVAVAALGGHLKRNGPPGWLTLSRGYERLLAWEEGALLAVEM